MPFVYDEARTLSMYFDMRSKQSTMHKNDSARLVLGYTRTMMGFLLFNPRPSRIGMIGLGGGSLAKYCLKHLPDAHFTAVEINPKVIALRKEFAIPPDHEKFQVIHADGADYVSSGSEKLDVILVDGFDADGHPAELCSTDFYDHCYARLDDGGVMVVNLLPSDQSMGTYVSRIHESFEGNVVVVNAEQDDNKIAFAHKGKDYSALSETIVQRVQTLAPDHPVQLQSTAQKILCEM